MEVSRVAQTLSVWSWLCTIGIPIHQVFCRVEVKMGQPCLYGTGFVQLVFQVSELFSRVKVRALCRTLKFLHTKGVEPCLYGAGLVQLAFQFISEVFSRVEVGALWKPFRFLHPNQSNHVFMLLAS